MTIVSDPYENVDLADVADPNGTGNPPKWEGHIHDRGPSPMDEMHGVVDYLADNGTDPEGHSVTEKYTIFSATRSNGDTWWPWTDPPYGESRDPEELEVIAVPGYEMHFGAHSYVFFSEASERTVRLGGLPEKLQDPIDDEDLWNPDAIVGFAHPGRYWSGANVSGREYERFRFNTGRLAAQNITGIIGLGSRNDPEVRNRNLNLWDRLLNDFAPDYRLWVTNHDDPLDNFGTGDGLDRRWVSVLVKSSEFDPSDQSSSRAACREAIASGETFAHIRDGWDPDSEEPATPPLPDKIETSDGTITVSSDADTTEWISSGGEVVETGETVSISQGDGYLRCQLFNAEETAATFTQPWMIDNS